jgi:mono/diheme cytochrome c family protein
MDTGRRRGTDTAGELGWFLGWILAGAAAALIIFAATAFGQDASLAPAGKRLFNDQGCYGCHTVGKTGTPIAPDLSRVGSKYTEAYLRAWLMDPQQQKPRAHMPQLSMSEAEARSLAAYLGSLR